MSNLIKENISVIIGSCDSYEPLWKNFQICFNNTWSHSTSNFFITENKTVPLYTNQEFISVLSTKQNWGARMLDGINACKTKYIFFILEDYFFTYSYSAEQLEEYINIMNLNSIDRLQISPSGFQHYIKINNSEKYLKFSKNSLYSISMQPSIWNKEYLQYVLSPEYSPWDFEIIGSQKISQDSYNHKIFIDRSIPNVYFNAVRKGFTKSVGWDTFKIEYNLEDF
jgi:hypothetical protein